MRKRAVAAIVVVALVVASIGFYEYSAYESTALDTTVVTGKITNIQGTPVPTPQPGVTATSGASLVTIKVGSDSFQQIVPCSPIRGYNVGDSIQVADQLLRSGAHQFAPDIACRGGVSPFRAIYPHGYTSTSTAT